MGARLEGKVAFISGGARGQGRSHAVRLAETVRQVEALDRRIIARQADVRDYDALKALADEGMAEFGRIDVVSANAGISGEMAEADVMSEDGWQSMIDINLTGVWHTVKAAIPHLKAGGNGGSIVITSSLAGLKGMGNIAHYVSAKHGLVGLMRTLAIELAPHSIRVNSIHPTQVDTPMIMNEATKKLFRPARSSSSRAQPGGRGAATPSDWLKRERTSSRSISAHPWRAWKASTTCRGRTSSRRPRDSWRPWTGGSSPGWRTSAISTP